MQLEEYPDVLSDELNPEPKKTDAPMHIHIMEGATPVSYTHLTLPTIYSV